MLINPFCAKEAEGMCRETPAVNYRRAQFNCITSHLHKSSDLPYVFLSPHVGCTLGPVVCHIGLVLLGAINYVMQAEL